MTVTVEGTFAKQFATRQDQLATDAENGSKSLQAGFLELIEMQNKEIARLTGILKNATEIPERYFVSVNISSFAVGDRDRQLAKYSATALANDKSAWCLMDFHPNAAPGIHRWHRLPALPQVSDEMGPAR